MARIRGQPVQPSGFDPPHDVAHQIIQGPPPVHQLGNPVEGPREGLRLRRIDELLHRAEVDGVARELNGGSARFGGLPPADPGEGPRIGDPLSAGMTEDPSPGRATAASAVVAAPPGDPVRVVGGVAHRVVVDGDDVVGDVEEGPGAAGDEDR